MLDFKNFFYLQVVCNFRVDTKGGDKRGTAQTRANSNNRGSDRAQPGQETYSPLHVQVRLK